MKKEAVLWERLDDGKVRCRLCAHGCTIADGKFGICGVRRNENGTLYSLVYAEPVAVHVDPIEKKPLYHFLPGTFSLSLATIGCNFKCGFCQNWQISQESKREGGAPAGDQAEPGLIVAAARRGRCRSISYTYTEPTIFFEYARDIAVLAREAGLRNIFVTNGYLTAEALALMDGLLDAANVDLKSFRDEYYRKYCRARLQPVLDTIALMKKMGIWIEITTLIIPGENDSATELKEIAGFVAGLDKNIPWHVSRFHPDYQFDKYPATPVETVEKAVDIGKKAGLNYVYPGNIAGGGDTVCPACGATLVRRNGFYACDIIGTPGVCSACGTRASGIWE